MTTTTTCSSSRGSSPSSGRPSRLVLGLVVGWLLACADVSRWWTGEAASSGLPSDFPLPALDAAQGALLDVHRRALTDVHTTTVQYTLAEGADVATVLDGYVAAFEAAGAEPRREPLRVTAPREDGLWTAQVVESDGRRLLSLVVVRRTPPAAP